MGAGARRAATFGVEAGPREGVPGCWCDGGRRKIGAVGVRIERGVSYHGIALNVTVRLSDFELIDACGMPGVESTSIGRELGKPAVPTTEFGGTRGRRLRVCDVPGAGGAARVEPAAGLHSARRSSRSRGDACRRVDPRGRSNRRPRRSSLMGAGLFELRRDAITGWWVATVVDREFQRGRFSLAAAAVDDGGTCQNCAQPDGDGVRIRTLKDYAFHVVGSQDEAREMERNLAATGTVAGPCLGELAHDRRPAGRAPPVPAGRLRNCQCSMLSHVRRALADAQKVGQTEYLQVVQNWGAQAGARPTTSASISTICLRFLTEWQRRSVGRRDT